jgi:hypothetical protein
LIKTEALETKKDPKTSTIKRSKLYNNGPQKIKFFFFYNRMKQRNKKIPEKQ